MLDFPQESIDRANEIISHYKKRTSSRLEIAAYLHDGKFLEIGYGFDEAIKSGNCGKYLHEIRTECDCFTKAGIIYLISRQAGFQPEIYEAYEMKDINEGENPANKALNNHTFVTVSLRQNKKQIIDPDMGAFGEITFNPEQNEIKIYNKAKSKLKTRKYATLKQLTEQEYLEKLQQARTSGGGRKALLGSQRLSATNKESTYLTYLPDSHSIKSSVHIGKALLGPEPYDKHVIIDLITKAKTNGEFDFNNGKLYFYNATTAGWCEHENPQTPLIIPVEKAQIIWDIWQDLAKKSGRKSPIYGMSPYRLEELIRQQGFNEDFSSTKDSNSEKLIKTKHEESFNLFLKVKKKIINDFLPRCKEDEISFKCLLRNAQYIKQRNSRKTKENPYGFLFSEQEHFKLLEQGFRDHTKHTVNLFQTLLHSTAIKAGLKPGSVYSANRIANPATNKYLEKARYFETLGGTKRFCIPIAFEMITDAHLFKKDIDIERISISDLSKDLKREDLKNTASLKIYHSLLNSLIYKRELFLSKYHKGLEKILSLK